MNNIFYNNNNYFFKIILKKETLSTLSPLFLGDKI